MSLGISGAGGSSQLARLLQSMQAAQNSQAGGFKPSSISDSLSSDSISSDGGTTSGTDVGQALSSTNLKAGAAADTASPFQQLSSEIQNLLLELQSFASQSPSTTPASGASAQSGMLDALTSNAQDSTGKVGLPHHGNDGDSDDALSTLASTSSGSTSSVDPLNSAPSQSDFSKLLADLGKAIQSFGATPIQSAANSSMPSAASVAA
jgi:hypothetical protein